MVLKVMLKCGSEINKEKFISTVMEICEIPRGYPHKEFMGICEFTWIFEEIEIHKDKIKLQLDKFIKALKNKDSRLEITYEMIEEE